MVCGVKFESIASHLRRHQMKAKDYHARFPGAAIMSPRVRNGAQRGCSVRALHLAYDGLAPDARLLSFMTGALLGDGSLERSKMSARWAEAGNNSKYMAWKHAMLQQYFPCTFKKRTSAPHVKSGKRYTAWWLRTAVHPLLTEWHSRWYSDVKIVPRDMIKDHLDELALAVWFCDDGHRDLCGSLIYTLSFAVDDVEFLRSVILDRFGIKTTLRMLKTKRRVLKPAIYVLAESRPILDAIVAKFAIPGMSYKSSLGKKPAGAFGDSCGPT
jgi:hypothetical protein